MDWLLERFVENRERTAITDPKGSYSYGELLQAIDAFEKQLEGQVAAGSVVAILSDYNLAAIACLLALVRNRNIIVPITATVAEEIEQRIAVGQCDQIIHIDDGKLRFEARPCGEKHALVARLIDRGHSGLVLFSSGSTGEPKAMIHDMNDLVDSYRDKKTKKLNLLIFLMFDHIGGLNTLINTLSMCAHIVIPASREADHIGALIEQHRINVLPASPTFLNLMLMSKVQDKYNLKTLRMITYGTEPMQESLLNQAREAFPRARFLQTYGTSETGIAQASSRSSDSLEIRFEDPDLETRIVDGELHLRSKTQILGYLNADMESFTEDGWFKTGDLVEQSEDGYLTIVGRSKEVINVGGEKVLPTEVESLLLRHELVADAMVKSIPNALTGQSVLAQVVLAASVEPREAKKILRRYCSESMASYKVPTRFSFVDEVNYSDRFKKMRLT